jgi:hypothetical protein
MSCWHIAVLLLFLAASCAAHPNSEDRAGEAVAIRLLDRDAIYTPPPDWSPAERDAYGKRVESVLGPNTGAAAGGLAAFAPVAVKAVIDWIADYLSSQADRYEAQYEACVYGDEFWAKPPSQTPDANSRFELRRKLFGFELTRTTTKHGASAPAMRLVVACVPSKDLSAFVMVPVAFKVRSTHAKIDESNALAAFEFEIAMSAMWVDKDSTARDALIASTLFRVPRYHVGTGEPRVEFDGATAGWFPSVPVSQTTKGEPYGLGLFKISVRTTERDTSRWQARIRRASDFVRDNRSRAVEAVGGEP